MLEISRTRDTCAPNFAPIAGPTEDQTKDDTSNKFFRQTLKLRVYFLDFGMVPSKSTTK